MPAVRISDEYQHYSDPFAIAFGPNTFTARDQDTNTFVVSAEQPLVAIGRGIQEYRSQEMTIAANEAQLHAAEDQIRSQVRAGYLRYFEAKALQDIARSSQHELGEQVTVAQARVKAGVLTTADVLRVQVALGNAQQQEIVARTQAEIARARLLIAIGLGPDDTSVELIDPDGSADCRPACAAGLCQCAGAERCAARPELVQGQRIADAADRQRRAKMLSLLPDVSLEGAYVRVDGQIFAPANSLYVGLKAQWTIWEWGDVLLCV